MITPDEREREDKAEAKERAKNMDGAALDWVFLADRYMEEGRSDCCYFCEAGRAYARAAADFEAAGIPDNAKNALISAASAYEACGNRCFEVAALLCAEVGFVQAKLINEMLEKMAKDASDDKAAADAKAKEDRLTKAIETLDRFKEQLEKDRQANLDRK